MSFILTAVFTITVGGRFGYDKIYKSAGRSDILAVFEDNVACPYTSLVPESYMPAIKEIGHVVDVASEIRQRYSFKRHQNLTLDAMDPDKILKFKDIEISKKEFDAFKRDPCAAIVGRKIFRMYGWRIGEDIYAFGLRFKIVGVFERPFSVYESMVFLHRDYLQELTSRQGLATSLLIKTDLRDPFRQKALMHKVEELFRDSPSKIICRPEAELWRDIQASQGDLGGIISAICICMGILLFVMDINSAFLLLRYRFQWICRLKEMGYQLRHVTRLMFVKAAALLGLSGALACLIVCGVLSRYPFYVGKDMFHPPIFIDPRVLFIGILVSLSSAIFAALACIPGTINAYRKTDHAF